MEDNLDPERRGDIIMQAFRKKLVKILVNFRSVQKISI